MDFTREPIIETVITPKEGCKLVVRSSKTLGQEEYFVDSIEVVSFGSAIFFRSTERPKAFIVPASDYEVLEAREARIVLKNVGLDKSIKIGGGREAAVRAPREAVLETPQEKDLAAPASDSASKTEPRGDRKRDRRRQYRKRRGRDETSTLTEEPQGLEGKVELQEPERQGTEEQISEAVSLTGTILSNLLAPPPLISETISRYKEKFSEAFYTKEEQEARLAANEEIPMTLPEISLEQPAFGAFEMSEEEEEEIYRQRKRRLFSEEEEDENEPIGFSTEEQALIKPSPEANESVQGAESKEDLTYPKEDI